MLRPDGLLIMHVGATRKFDMAEQLVPLLEPPFRLLCDGAEHLEGPSRGLSDKARRPPPLPLLPPHVAGRAGEPASVWRGAVVHIVGEWRREHVTVHSRGRSQRRWQARGQN